MIINSNFTFTLTTSVDGYSGKEESIDCLKNSTATKWGKKQMAFYETTLNTDQFISLALSGHSFSGLYNLQPSQKYEDEYGHKINAFYTQKNDYRRGAMKIQFKKNEYFKSSQVVYVDIDETKFKNIQDYVSTLTYKPTCVYTTFSDGLEKHQGKGDISRRFRLVYVLDSQLSEDYWKAVSISISEAVKNDTGEEVDCCGNRITQHMNGSCGSETYISYCIYSPLDFQYLQYLPQYQIPKTVSQELQDNTSGSEEFCLDELLIKDMETLDYAKFMKKYSRVYKYFYRTEREDWISFGSVDYQVPDDSYLQLWFYPKKIQDGEGRRQTIANRAFQLRLINPQADINTILFNLYIFREKYIDNSDGTITIRVLVNRAKLVFQKDDISRNMQEQKRWIEYCKKNKPGFITRSNVFKVVPQSIINQIQKELNHQEISKFYNPSLSVKENLEVLKANGVKVKKTALYDYLDSKWIDYKKKSQRKIRKEGKEKEIELFKELYNPSLSERENAKIMEASGLKISKNTVKSWANKYIQETEKTELYLPELSIPEIKVDLPETNSSPEPKKESPFFFEPPKFNFGF